MGHCIKQRLYALYTLPRAELGLTQPLLCAACAFYMRSAKHSQGFCCAKASSSLQSLTILAVSSCLCQISCSIGYSFIIIIFMHRKQEVDACCVLHFKNNIVLANPANHISQLFVVIDVHAPKFFFFYICFLFPPFRQERTRQVAMPWSLRRMR